MPDIFVKVNNPSVSIRERDFRLGRCIQCSLLVRRKEAGLEELTRLTRAATEVQASCLLGQCPVPHTMFII